MAIASSSISRRTPGRGQPADGKPFRILPAPKAEEELPRHHRCRGRGGVRDDRRVDAHDRTGHAESRSCEVVWAIAPMTLQTKALSSWRSVRMEVIEITK
jgi:hypothetical protein